MGKEKTKFRTRFNNYKSVHRSYKKKRITAAFSRTLNGQHSHDGIDNWRFTLTEQCETHEQLST